MDPMLELVRKDLIAGRWLLGLVLPLGCVQVGVMAFHPFSYALGACTFAAVLGFASLVIEEYEQTEGLWNSLPISRRTFVTARYLTTLLGIVTGLALSWLLAAAIRELAVGTGAEGMVLLGIRAHLLLFALLALAAAVYLPLYFWFGAGRALAWFAAIGIVLLLLGTLVTDRVLAGMGYPGGATNPEAMRALLERGTAWIGPHITELTAGIAGGSILFLDLSLLVSRHAYEGRDV
jgi:hypothetical protein